MIHRISPNQAWIRKDVMVQQAPKQVVDHHSNFMPKPSQQVKQVWQRKKLHLDSKTIQKSKQQRVWKRKLNANGKLEDTIITIQEN